MTFWVHAHKDKIYKYVYHLTEFLLEYVERNNKHYFSFPKNIFCTNKPSELSWVEFSLGSGHNSDIKPSGDSIGNKSSNTVKNRIWTYNLKVCSNLSNWNIFKP